MMKVNFIVMKMEQKTLGNFTVIILQKKHKINYKLQEINMIKLFKEKNID